MRPASGYSTYGVEIYIFFGSCNNMCSNGLPYGIYIHSVSVEVEEKVHLGELQLLDSAKFRIHIVRSEKSRLGTKQNYQVGCLLQFCCLARWSDVILL